MQKLLKKSSFFVLDDWLISRMQFAKHTESSAKSELVSAMRALGIFNFTPQEEDQQLRHWLSQLKGTHKKVEHSLHSFPKCKDPKGGLWAYCNS